MRGAFPLTHGKQRNSQRDSTKKIPLVGILDTYKKLEMPSYEEGFDRLFYVKIDADNLFIVENLRLITN